MKLLLLLSIVLLGCNGEINVELSNVYVLRGDDAEIPCKYSTALTGEPTIKWYVVEDNQNELLYQIKVGSTAGVIDNSGNYDRPTYVSETGTLTLTNTDLRDNEIFKTLECEVSIGTDTNSARLELNVIALPPRAPIFKPTANSFSPGSKISVGSCESGGGGEPLPTITFYKNSEEIGASENDNEEIGTTESGEDDFYADLLGDAVTWDAGEGTTGIKDSLVTDLTRHDNNATYYCIVESGFKGTDVYQRQNLTIPRFHVNYATDKVQFVDAPSFVFAGTDLELTCSANGYPEPSVLINKRQGSTMTVDVEKEIDGKVYTCQASNDKAMDSGSLVSTSYTLNVLYADDLSIEGLTNVTYGESISLSCMSHSKPSSTGVYWKKGGESVSENADLTISKATFSNAGNYECVAPNNYEQLEKTKEVEVYVYGLVVATQTYQVSSEESSDIILTCKATSYPDPHFSWTRKAEGEDSTEVEVTGAKIKSHGNNKHESVLTVGSLTSELSKATYTCRVTNEKSQAKTTTFTLPAMAQASSAGIIIGILVAVIVVAIILAVLYNKGIICGKKDDGEEDAKDIAVRMSKDEEAPEDNGDNHQSNYQQDQVGEQTELMNGEQNS